MKIWPPLRRVLGRITALISALIVEVIFVMNMTYFISWSEKDLNKDLLNHNLKDLIVFWGVPKAFDSLAQGSNFKLKQVGIEGELLERLMTI